MSDDIEIEIFSRPECHLCDVLLELVGELEGLYPLNLKVTNVETDPQLEQKYGSQVPVVRIAGHSTFTYPIRPAALERELKRLWKR